jgi:uncharacterized glyoxalase superfamily protein PhnB
VSSRGPDTSAVASLGAYACLTYRDVRGAVGWLHAAFGVEGELLTLPGTDEREPVDHALLRVGGSTILVESERPEELHGAHAGRGWVYIAVSDADAHYQGTVAAGVSVHGEPHDYGSGFRGYSAPDLEGNLWTFGTAQP